MGSDGDELFGKVVVVSQELLPGTNIPAYCTVQARGVARFAYTGTVPQVNQKVVVDGMGKVRWASTSCWPLVRGQVIAADTINHTCDVWLG